MPPFRCATCVFFSQHQPDWLDRPSTRGQCRRHAPVLDRHDDGRLRTVWPMVHEDGFCGEHAEVEVEGGVDQEPARPSPPPLVQQTPPPSPGPSWRCVNCKEVEISMTEPSKCVVCQCREFAKVAPE